MSICSQYNSYGFCSLLGVSLSECFETHVLDKNISSLAYSSDRHVYHSYIWNILKGTPTDTSSSI